MKNRLKIILSAVSILSFLFTGSVYAKDGQWGFKKKFKDKKNGYFMKLTKELNLTEEQQKKLTENKKMMMEQSKEFRQEMRNAMDEMRQELQKPELDMNKINTIQTKIKNLAVQKEDRKLQNVLEIRNILSSEQFSKFNENIEKGHKKLMKKIKKRHSSEKNK